MRGIRVENGRVVYFGNPVGYIAGGQTMMDPTSKGKELEAYLRRQGGTETVVRKSGVYDRPTNGRAGIQGYEPLKSCRVWQLKPDVNIRMRFIGYDTLVAKSGEPDPQSYHMVYDGKVEADELERTYGKFGDEQEVPGCMGHPPSMSDVIEPYDEEVGEFCHVDYRDFKPVVSRGPEPVQSQVFQLQQ